jgi:hypothetical protein
MTPTQLRRDDRTREPAKVRLKFVVLDIMYIIGEPTERAEVDAIVR